MITAQVEDFSVGLSELKPLLPLHYEELALDKDNVPLDPQYGVYLARDAMGEVIYVTLREDGKLAGYFIGFAAPGLHYATCLTLTMDIFYIAPDHRGNGGGLILFDAVRTESVRRGVKRWFVGDKCHAAFHAENLFRAIGFEKVEHYWSIWLGDK